MGKSDKTYTITTKARAAGTATVTITFENGATASSTVTIDEKAITGEIKGNIKNSETYEPVNGVELQLFDINGDIVSTADTDENGNFSLICNNGTYKILFIKEGYVSFTKSDVIIDDEIVNLGTVYLTDLSNAGGIKGTVIDIKTGTPLNGVKILLVDDYREDNIIATFQSDENGNFEFYCENDIYTLIFEKEGYKNINIGMFTRKLLTLVKSA